MVKKRGKLLVLLLTMSFFVTGCWDSIEVNALNLTTLVVMDKKDGVFAFTVEIPKIMPTSAGGGGGGGDGSKYAYLKGSGESFPKARDNLGMQLDKPLFLGTVRTLIITEKAAENDLAEYLLRLREDFNYRQKVIMVTTKEDPAELTKPENEAESPIGVTVDDTLKTLMEHGNTFYKTSERYIEDILNGRGFVVHCMNLKDKQIAVTDYSVFRNAKCIGSIPVEDSRGLIYLFADKAIWVYRIPYETSHATVNVELGKKKIVPSYQEGVIRFSVQLKFKATVQYTSQAELFPISESVQKEITQNLEQVLYEEIRSTIELSQKEFQTDYLLFDEAFRIAYPDAFEMMDWNTVYPNVEIALQTKVDLTISNKMEYEPS